jgi:CBS domain-containing protein
MMKTAGDIINEKGSAIYSVPIEATIADAIKLMVDKRIGAVLVVRDGKMVGIWTERDLLRSSLAGEFNPQSAHIADHMTPNLITVPHTETLYRLMDKFLGLRLRHLPVEKDGKIIGLLSSGDVINTALVEKTREFDELNKMVSWEYYENWRWKK